VNHADIKKHLADYLEGEIPIDDRALVDAHLDACDSCAGEVEEMLQTIRLLRTLPEPELPPMIAANVMRRIRSGESRLGFFGRIGRALSAVLEPAFVLPASAIAAAALVVAVFQGLNVVPTSDVGRDSLNEVQRSLRRGEPSVASLSPSIGAARRGERARAYGAFGASNGMDIVARVERRATQSDRIQQTGGSPRTPRTAAGSGTRIRIKLKGLGFARESTSEQSTPQMPRIAERSMSSGSSVLTSRISDAWPTDSSRIMSGNTSDVASRGALVVAERLGAGDFTARSGVWPQTLAQGEFLTGADDIRGSDPRDAWLALGFEDPAEFARYIAGRNLAEQELWAARLSERAEARGLLDEFLQALRESGDPTAAWVADDFSAQAERAQGHFSEAEDQFSH
jgi:anti-sigma factor RsiW